MRFVGIMQGCKNPGDHIFVQGLLSLSLSICVIIRKCGLQNFGKYNFEKIVSYIEKITRDYQNGFRDGRSVIGNIFVLKIINEKIWEYNQSVQYLFIDFQKAYDSVHRDTL